MDPNQITSDGLSSSPDRFTEWFVEEHSTGEVFELESDADECDEDRYDDPESY